jgi:hypothetical protein
MDLAKVLAHLHKELDNLNAAIATLERLQQRGRRRGRPPKLVSARASRAIELTGSRRLEWNVVVRDALIQVVRRFGGGGLRTGSGARHGNRRRELAGGPSGRPGSVAAAAQQNQFVADHFREVLLLPILVFVAAGLQVAFDIDLLTLQ